MGILGYIITFFIGSLSGMLCMAILAAGNNRDEIL